MVFNTYCLIISKFSCRQLWRELKDFATTRMSLQFSHFVRPKNVMSKRTPFYCNAASGTLCEDVRTFYCLPAYKFALKALLSQHSIFYIVNKDINTHRMHCCVCTAIVLTRTFHSVTLHVRCLSCSFLCFFLWISPPHSCVAFIWLTQMYQSSAHSAPSGVGGELILLKFWKVILWCNSAGIQIPKPSAFLNMIMYWTYVLLG